MRIERILEVPDRIYVKIGAAGPPIDVTSNEVIALNWTNEGYVVVLYAGKSQWWPGLETT